jgi:hypothetical protein
MEIAKARVNLVKFIRVMKAEAEKIDWKAKLMSQRQQLQSITKDKLKLIESNLNYMYEISIQILLILIENLCKYGPSIKTKLYPLRSCYVNWPSLAGNKLRIAGRTLKTPKVKMRNRNRITTV